MSLHLAGTFYSSCKCDFYTFDWPWYNMLCQCDFGGGGRGYSALRQENMEYPSTERGGGREGGEGIDGYTIPSW